MFEALTKVVAYIFTFMFLVVGICIGLVLYIDSIPQATAVTEAAPAPAPAIVLNEVQQTGKAIFNTNCASCHRLNKKAVGPALAGVTDKYETEWLYSWIKNSQALIASGDAAAIKIYEEYNQSNMNSFPLLSNEDIDAILAYTDAYK